MSESMKWNSLGMGEIFPQLLLIYLMHMSEGNLLQENYRLGNSILDQFVL
jgi:hypothetical protein